MNRRVRLTVGLCEPASYESPVVARRLESRLNLVTTFADTASCPSAQQRTRFFKMLRELFRQRTGGFRLTLVPFPRGQFLMSLDNPDHRRFWGRGVA